MKIPKKIYDVLNNKRNFDFLFLEMLRHQSPEDAYDSALDLVRKYAPHFKHYKDFDSYRVILSNKNNREIEVPEEIINAVTKGIDDLFHKHLKKVKIRKMAYDQCVKEINIYLPNYKPFKNYQSFKALQSINYKKNH
jgi:2-polyprenyl-3-methyl-5-hydroxy-6-metoxy-1,4-benzoquinol methylase